MATFLTGWYQNVAAAGAFVNLTALAEQVIFTETTNVHVPKDTTQVIAVAAGVGAGGNGMARLESPSLRGVTRFNVETVNGRNDGNVIPDTVPYVHDLRATPIQLAPGETLLGTIHSSTTLAARQWVLVWLADAPPARFTGKVYTVRATGTTTLTAGAWTNGSITFDDAIPAGRWTVVGFRTRSANLVAARLVFPGQAWRPGVLGATLQQGFTPHIFRYGELGIMGAFDLDTIPTVDYLANVADTAEVVYLDITPAA